MGSRFAPQGSAEKPALTPSGKELLGQVESFGIADAYELSVHVPYTQGTIRNTLMELKRLGLVEGRRSGEKRSRRYNYVITEKGMSLLRRESPSAETENLISESLSGLRAYRTPALRGL